MNGINVTTPIIEAIYEKETEYAKLAEWNLTSRQTGVREELLNQMNQINISKITAFDPELKKFIKPKDIHKYQIAIDETGDLILGAYDSNKDYYELEIVSCVVKG